MGFFFFRTTLQELMVGLEHFCSKCCLSQFRLNLKCDGPYNSDCISAVLVCMCLIICLSEFIMIGEFWKEIKKKLDDCRVFCSTWETGY